MWTPSYLLCCGQVQQFRGTDVDSVEIGASGDKNPFEDGNFQKRLQSLVSSIDKKRVTKSKLTKL